MIINHDYTDFNPNGFSLPPEGRFLQRVVEEKFGTKPQDKGGYAFLTLTIQIEEGKNKGQKYNLDFNTGHTSVQTSKIAMTSLGRIYYGVTGEKPPVRGFDTAILQRAPFYGVISIKESPKNDGTQDVYRSVNLNNIEPINPPAQAVNGVVNNAALMVQHQPQYQPQPVQAAVNAAPVNTHYAPVASGPWDQNPQ